MESFSYSPDNVTNTKDRYYIGHELDGGSGSYSGHDLTIRAHQIFYSWLYDLDFAGSYVFDTYGELDGGQNFG